MHMNQRILHRIEEHTGKGLLVGFVMTSSVIAYMTSIKPDLGSVLEGTDTEGDENFIDVEKIAAIVFMDRPAKDGEPEEPMDSLVTEGMQKWQDAFMRLRAACDASSDPAVADAVADLEALEEAQRAEAGNGV